MGTHACTRIQNASDYIEMHTRWDGFPNEIKQKLKKSIYEWSSLSTYVLNQIKAKNLSLPEIEQWAIATQDWLKEIQENPTIEAYTAMLCGRSFNHHHVLPVLTQKTSDLLDYWGQGQPDVVMTINKKDDFSYLKNKKIKNGIIKEKPVNEEFFMVRIKDETEEYLGKDNFDQHSFLDLKVKGMTHEEFNQMIMSLPLFWLELHTLVRQPGWDSEDQRSINQQLSFYKEYPLVRYLSGHNLQNFYSPSEQYIQIGKAKLKDYDTLLDDVSALIPFDFSSSSLATHLYILSSGKIQPMTFAEELWASKQNKEKFVQVSVIPEQDRTNLILIQSNNIETSENCLQNHVEKNNQRFDNFLKQLDPDFQFEVKPAYIISSNKNLGFNYEKNMLSYFHILTTIDHQLKKERKLKP